METVPCTEILAAINTKSPPCRLPVLDTSIFVAFRDILHIAPEHLMAPITTSVLFARRLHSLHVTIASLSIRISWPTIIEDIVCVPRETAATFIGEHPRQRMSQRINRAHTFTESCLRHLQARRLQFLLSLFPPLMVGSISLAVTFPTAMQTLM